MQRERLEVDESESVVGRKDDNFPDDI